MGDLATKTDMRELEAKLETRLREMEARLLAKIKAQTALLARQQITAMVAYTAICAVVVGLLS